MFTLQRTVGTMFTIQRTVGAMFTIQRTVGTMFTIQRTVGTMFTIQRTVGTMYIVQCTGVNVIYLYNQYIYVLLHYACILSIMAILNVVIIDIMLLK